MTSSERKIINCLWETKEKTHIRLVAQKANLSSDYARLLCRSLARSGHIKFENDLAHLLKKGRSRFENNDPVADGPIAVAANVTLLTDEPAVVSPAVVSPANDRSDEEENQTEDASEDKDKDKPASSDEQLDRALADLEPSSPKDESEEKDKSEEPKDETELKPEPKAEEEKETAPETEMKTVTDTADGKEEAKAENPEKVALKEEPAKPSGGFGASFKKIVNWFAEKK